MMEERQYLLKARTFWTYAYMFQNAEYWDESIKNGCDAVLPQASDTEEEPQTINVPAFDNVLDPTLKTEINELSTERNIGPPGCSIIKVDEQLNDDVTSVLGCFMKTEIDEQLAEDQIAASGRTEKGQIDEKSNENESAAATCAINSDMNNEQFSENEEFVPFSAIKAEIDEQFCDTEVAAPSPSPTFKTEIDVPSQMVATEINKQFIEKNISVPFSAVKSEIPADNVSPVLDQTVIPNQIEFNMAVESGTLTADKNEQFAVDERDVFNQTVNMKNLAPSSEVDIDDNKSPCPSVKVSESNEIVTVEDTTNKEAVPPTKRYSMYWCYYCKKEFRRPAELLIHSRTHTEERPFPCPQCEKKFKQKIHLTNHLRIHTDERPFSCDRCDYTCRTKGNLTIHINSHTGKKPLKCDYCDYSCTQKSNLDDHMRTHTGDRPFACGVCGASFKQRNALKDHSRIHSREKPFRCEECGKSFSWRRSLKEHKYTHTGEEPYVCRVCGKTFARSGNLYYHTKQCSSTTMSDGMN